MPLISVIIPTFNYARFLRQALDSALNQKGVSAEVIVVDDGSTDETPDMLAAYGSEINVIRLKHQGLSAARNAGLNMAGGAFVVFLDADDVLPRGALASQDRVLQEDPDADAVVCQSFFFKTCDDEGAPIMTGRWRLFKKDLEVHLCHFNIAPPHAFMFKRSVFNRVGLFDPSLTACEDHDMWFRLAFNGAKLKTNPKLDVPYRRHPGSVSQNVENQWLHDAKLHLRISDALKESDFPLKRRAAGLLGCVAGCLCTARRLDDRYPETSGDLRRKALQTLRRIPVKKQKVVRRSLMEEFFLLRIARELSDPLRHGAPWAKDLCACIEGRHDSRIGTWLELRNEAIGDLLEQKMEEVTWEGLHPSRSLAHFDTS